VSWMMDSLAGPNGHAVAARLIADFLNRGFDMTELTGYFCRKCTATKQYDWQHCPFCGCQEFYWRIDNKMHFAEGRPRKLINSTHPLNDGVQDRGYDPMNRAGCAQEQTAQTTKACEDRRTYPLYDQIRTCLIAAENKFNEQVELNESLRRDRHGLRDRIKGLEATIENQQKAAIAQGREIDRLRATKPAPLGIKQVIGVRSTDDSETHYPLAITRIDHGPQGTTITVLL